MALALAFSDAPNNTDYSYICVLSSNWLKKKPPIWALIFIAAKARAKLFFLIMQTATENNNIIEMTMVVS